MRSVLFFLLWMGVPGLMAAQENLPEKDSVPSPLEIRDKNAVVDPAGMVYSTIVLNQQTWLAENLNFEVEDSYCYEQEPNNCEQYGRLYNWETAQFICENLGPDWRLPTNVDFDFIFDNIYPHTKLLPGGGSGFNIQLGGISKWIGANQIFVSKGQIGGFWSSTTHNSNSGITYSFSDEFFRPSIDIPRSSGYSIRCVRDN